MLPHLRASDKGGGAWEGTRSGERGSVWVEAPVPPLPQFPIEEHGKGSWPSLFIYNAGSCYSCGTGPGCGRLKRVEKSNMQALRCQMAGQETGSLNQITLVALARLLLSTFRNWQRREEGRDGGRKAMTA